MQFWNEYEVSEEYFDLHTRISPVARSTRDLLNTLAAIGAAKATFRRCTMPGLTPPRPAAA